MQILTKHDELALFFRVVPWLLIAKYIAWEICGDFNVYRIMPQEFWQTNVEVMLAYVGGPLTPECEIGAFQMGIRCSKR